MGTRSGYKRGWYSRSIYYSQQARRNDFPLEYRKIFTLDNFSLGFLLTWIRLYRKRVSDILMLCAIFAIEMILYKYYPCSKYTLTSLAVNGLWCHYATMMNDPFECLWTIDRQFTEELLNEFKGYSRQAKSQTLNRLSTLDDLKLTEFINKLRRDSVKKFAFSSLSEDPYDILMWSHYADGHAGICVGIDDGWFTDFIEQEWETNKLIGGTPVSYKEQPDFHDVVAKYVEREASGKSIVLDHMFVDIVMPVLRTKSEGWRYEQEYRVIRREPGIVQVPEEAIKEVIVGKRISEGDYALLQAILSKPSLSHVRVGRAEFGENSFLMDIQYVNE